MIEVIRYSKIKKEEWDDFARHSSIDSFLFFRDYMEYHSDRFSDFSLMVYKENKLKLILPANTRDHILYSHQGLTFGGIVTEKNLKSIDVISYFEAIHQFLKENRIHKMIYKVSPSIYNNGSEIDSYLMFRFNAVLTSRLLTSVIDLNKAFKPNRNRIRNLKRARDYNININESNDIMQFWEIMTNNLKSKFNVAPVHSPAEIQLLQSRFPERIKLFTAKSENKLLGGMIIYFFDEVIKVQYAHASPEGKKLGTIDALYFYLYETYCNTFKFIDFGNSNEKGGQVINSGLLSQKEAFGAYGVITDTYAYEIP
ncbi:hypothetical protein [Carboxylicivirga sp. RSCT41]|uniref:hypothetical protein n=1 Tax=Carboxylicivirga agarovorans TaxID=3417570 RepID=UPI003D337F54